MKEPLLFGVAFNQFNLLSTTAGELHVAECFLINRKEAHGRTIFWRHVGNGCSIGKRHASKASTKELNKLTNNTLFAECFGYRQYKISRSRAGWKAASQLKADDFWHE